MKIHWTRLALLRVDEIVDRIARERPKIAEGWAVELFDLVEKLEASPLRGRVVPEFGREEVRELLYGKYRVIYRLGSGTIDILTVRHGRRLLAPTDVEEAV